MRASLLTTAAWIAVTAATAGAMWVDVPLPKMIADSDAIVIGTVVDVGKVEQIETQPPGMKKPVNIWCQVYTLVVKEALRDRAGALTPKKAGDTEKADKAEAKEPAAAAADKAKAKPVRIRVLARAEDPNRRGGLMISDGPAYPNLRPGQTYALILNSHKVKDKADYWLPAYPKNFHRVKKAADKRLARLRALADVEAWPWGEAVDGLQIALIPERTTARVFAARVRGRGPVREARLPCTVALRNTGKEPQVVNQYPGDGFLSVVYRRADGEARECDTAGGAGPHPPAFNPKLHLRTLQPGEMVFLHEGGISQYSYVQLRLPPEPGALRLTVDYRSSRKVEGQDPPLWAGTVASKPTGIKVVDPRARRPVPKKVLAPGPE